MLTTQSSRRPTATTRAYDFPLVSLGLSLSLRCAARRRCIKSWQAGETWRASNVVSDRRAAVTKSAAPAPAAATDNSSGGGGSSISSDPTRSLLSRRFHSLSASLLENVWDICPHGPLLFFSFLL